MNKKKWANPDTATKVFPGDSDRFCVCQRLKEISRIGDDNFKLLPILKN
jgi:hypothetical protein